MVNLILIFIISTTLITLSFAYHFSKTPSSAPSSSSSLYAGLSQSVEIDGMKCNGCLLKVEKALQNLDPNTQVTLDPPIAVFQVPVNLDQINQALAIIGNYKARISSGSLVKKTISWTTFLPLVSIFSLISFGTLALQWKHHEIMNINKAMHDFMGLYFLVFSLFKLVNLKGFVDAFTMYDLIAIRHSEYACVYPFIELALGVLYLRNSFTFALNAFTFILMNISSLGVFQALRQQKTIKCACLGSLFNLPMTYVSLFEDVLMSVMAFVCLVRAGSKSKLY
jgi:copper chaperone CopZ